MGRARMRSCIGLLFVLLLHLLWSATALPLGQTPGRQPSQSRNHSQVLIIGAGAAGYAAAARLMENGFFDLTVLEAENRIGGRINTVRLADNLVELGAEWVHGEVGNVVYEMAEPLEMLSHHNKHLDSNMVFVWSGGATADQQDIQLLLNASNAIRANVDSLRDYSGSYGEWFLDQFSQRLMAMERRPSSELVDRYLGWFEKATGFYDGSDTWYNTSGRGLTHYKECDGDLALTWKRNGYRSIFDLLTKRYPNPVQELPVRQRVVLGSEVRAIRWGRRVFGDLPVVYPDTHNEVIDVTEVTDPPAPQRTALYTRAAVPTESMEVSIAETSGVSTGVPTGVAMDVSTGVATEVSMGVGTDVSTGVATEVSTGVATEVVMGVSTGATTGVSTGESSTGVSTDSSPTGVSTGVSAGETAEVSSGVPAMETAGVSTGSPTTSSEPMSVGEDEATVETSSEPAGVSTDGSTDTVSTSTGTEEEEGSVSPATRLGRKARSVDGSADPIVVELSNGARYTADMVIVTVSLGVLKHSADVLFDPPLHPRKMRAVQNLGFGQVNKLFMYFSEPWWPSNLSGYSVLVSEEDLEEFKRKYPQYGVRGHWVHGLSGFYIDQHKPNVVLMDWVVGEAARVMERYSDYQIMMGCKNWLEMFLGHNYSIPLPIGFTRSKWWSNPHFRGSYSYRSLDSDHANAWAAHLAEPIMDTQGRPAVMFAGEATHDYYYSTVHGAIETGWREADRILHTLKSDGRFRTAYNQERNRIP